jgi:hypothetical protein
MMVRKAMMLWSNVAAQRVMRGKLPKGMMMRKIACADGIGRRGLSKCASRHPDRKCDCKQDSDHDTSPF